MIEPMDKSCYKIFQRIREDGVMKVKGFFYASISKSGVFKLQADLCCPLKIGRNLKQKQ